MEKVSQITLSSSYPSNYRDKRKHIEVAKQEAAKKRRNEATKSVEAWSRKYYNDLKHLFNVPPLVSQNSFESFTSIDRVLGKFEEAYNHELLND